MEASKIDEMVEHYLIAALWTSTDENDEPLDGYCSLIDVSDECRRCAKDDCTDFFNSAHGLLANITPEQAGHDFWLTRNRHGAGFWDRGLGKVGDDLTDLCHSYGDVHMYVSDKDGLVYCE